MALLRYKQGVTLTPNVAGGRLQGAIERVARSWPADLTITAGSDSHGADDPHTKGQAFDVRTHGFTEREKQTLLIDVLSDLRDGPDDPVQEMPIPGIWYAVHTARWFAQIEHHLEDSEHAHFQLRNAAVFP